MGHRADDQLRRLAERLVDAGASAWGFMSFVHRLYGGRDGRFWPNQFCADKTWELFLEALPDENRNRRIMLWEHVNSIAVEMRKGRDIAEILYDDALKINPLFRYWLASKEGLGDLRLALEEAAFRVYRREPDYWQAIQDIEKGARHGGAE